MALPLLPLALLVGAVATLFAGTPKPAPVPATRPEEDPLSGGTGGTGLEDDGTEPDILFEEDPVLDLPTLEDEYETPSWDQIVPCATDLKGHDIDAAVFAATGQRSLIVMLTCERESELEVEFHLACEEDETDAFDSLVLHRDDIDPDDPYNADLLNIIENWCGDKQGAFGVVYYDSQGPRLLVYDGFVGAASTILSYPNVAGMDSFDVVDIAIELALNGTISGVDGNVIDGEEYDALLVEP
jgi:hypothetical protein